MKNHLYSTLAFTTILFLTNTHAHAKEEKSNIDEITKLLKLNLQEIETLKKNQNKILETFDNNSIDFFNTILTPIILSIIAGLIFWIFFQLIPSHLRKIKISPKIKIDLLKINEDLFSCFNLIMKNEAFSESLFKTEIRYHILSNEQIELGLQNKSLNRSYLYGKYTDNIAIGEKLNELFIGLDKNIDRIFNFNEILSVQEIILLEKIHQRINEHSLYNYDQKNHIEVNDKIIYYSNQSLAYMSENFIALYKLYIELDLICIKIKIKEKNNNEDFLKNKIKLNYLNKNYKKTTLLIFWQKIKRNKTEYLDWEDVIVTHKINQEKSYEKLKKLLKKSKTELVSNRHNLARINMDENIDLILKNNVPNDQYGLYKNKIEEKEKFLEKCRTLKEN